MILDNLVGAPFGVTSWQAESLETDPLREDDALQEAQVLDLRLEVLTLTAAVLIELRTALQLRIPNTGLLVARGVENLIWDAEPRHTDLTAWNIMASRVWDVERRLHVRLGLYPNADITFTAINMAFYGVDALGVGDIIPDYGEPDALRQHPDLAQWTSPIEVLGATFRSAL